MKRTIELARPSLIIQEIMVETVFITFYDESLLGPNMKSRREQVFDDGVNNDPDDGM